RFHRLPASFAAPPRRHHRRPPRGSDHLVPDRKRGGPRRSGGPLQILLQARPLSDGAPRSIIDRGRVRPPHLVPDVTAGLRLTGVIARMHYKPSIHVFCAVPPRDASYSSKAKIKSWPEASAKSS